MATVIEKISEEIYVDESFNNYRYIYFCVYRFYKTSFLVIK